MDFALEKRSPTSLLKRSYDILIVVVNATVSKGDEAMTALIASAQAKGEMPSGPGQWLDVYRAAGGKVKRLVFVPAAGGKPEDLQKSVAAVVGHVKPGKPAMLGVHFMQVPEAPLLRAAMLAVAEASYVYTATKSKTTGRTLEKVVISCPETRGLQDSFAKICATISGIEFAKEWGNRPANHATPDHLAKAAQQLAGASTVTCKVMGPKEVARLGMGAFQAVAKGSEMPLRFIELRYQGDRKSVPPVVLVGKGITFDSGGISLKPAPDMDEMKFDMCGAASVLGVFKALADLKPKINVVGLIPSCENLPSGRSVKPGDVVTSMSGQTIEILNTDAEGRLILCDALTYAERFKPRAVIDIATLTGACVIALGAVRSGMFSSDQALGTALVAAGDDSLDLCWPMPLDDAYSEGLKTNFADVANVAGRAAGSVTAAKFLQRFAGAFPWAHLDIAGTAWKSGSAKGATGRPVGLLLSFLMSHAR